MNSAVIMGQEVKREILSSKSADTQLHVVMVSSQEQELLDSICNNVTLYLFFSVSGSTN